LQLSEHQLGQVFSQHPNQRLHPWRNPHQRPHLLRNLHLRLHQLCNLHQHLHLHRSRNLHQRPHQLCNLQPRVLRLQLALRFPRVFQTSCFRQLCVALFLNMALMSTLWLALVQVVVLPVKMF
jgi:hypothetical protein